MPAMKSFQVQVKKFLPFAVSFVKANWPAFALIAMATVSKIIGFLRNSFIAYYFGASHDADLLGILVFPTDFVTSYLMNQTIITALTIYFSKKEESQNDVFWRTFHFYRVLLTLAAIVLSVVMTFMYPEVPWYIALLASLPGILYGIAGIIQSYLNYNRVFLWPGAQELIAHFFLLIGVIIASQFGVWSYVIVLILTGIIRIIVQLPNLAVYLRKSHRKFSELFGWSQVNFEKELIIFVGPLLVTFILSGVPGFMVLDKLHAAGEGMIAAYNYAVKIIGLFNPIFIVPITTYLIPTLQRRAKEGRSIELLNTVAISLIAVFSFLFALLLVVAPEFLVKIIYARGQFDQLALQLTSQFLKFQAFAVVGYALMYYLMQLTLIDNRGKRLIASYVTGTIVIMLGLLFLPFAPYVSVGISFTIGVFASLAILLF